MTCVLRISGPSVPATLAALPITPYRVENMTAHFSASEAPVGDLPTQIPDTVVFLTANRTAIEMLMATPNATGELDFATAYEPGAFTSNTVSAILVRLVGELGVEVTVSGYRQEGPP